MKEDVVQRIKEVYALKSGSETQFAKMIGVKQRTINQQLKGERSISLDSVLAVLSSFEDISAEWLLRGTGAMFKEENSYYPSALGEESNNYSVSVQELKEKIISLEAENKVLRELVGLKEKEKKSEKIA